MGTYITTLTATDKDSGSNGEITYNFGSGDTANFRIDADLGNFITAGILPTIEFGLSVQVTFTPCVSI